MRRDRDRAERDERKAAAGFSLSEVLAVVALMALLILFGGPAMAEAYRAYQVRSAANNLTTDLRAQRYMAVTNHATRTLTINNTGHATAPNQYTYLNPLGQTIIARLNGVTIESTSAASIAFNNRGSTGTTATLNVILSRAIDSTRGDRYTVSVSPTGTVSSSYSTYVP